MLAQRFMRLGLLFAPQGLLILGVVRVEFIMSDWDLDCSPKGF